MMRKTIAALLVAPTLALAAVPPAQAGNSLIAAGRKVAVAKSGMTVVPPTEWNKLGARPGKQAELWTMDGAELDKVVFFGGIGEGGTLLRDSDRKNRPLPRFKASMLVTDIAPFLESSYRVKYRIAAFTIDSVEPDSFGGASGVRFTYSFQNPDEELPRRGEARAALVQGKLYMIAYEAPSLHYFPKYLEAFRGLTDSARL